MSNQSLDVFALREHVVREYSSFARSFTRIADQRLSDQVENTYADSRYWPPPLIQINPTYATDGTVAERVGSGDLHPKTGGIFRTGPSDTAGGGGSLSLYTHQAEALAFAHKRESFVVTTGTGSGKSLCFFIPIVDAILRERDHDATKRTRAIVIYPMNALANSQFEELEKYLDNLGPNVPRPVQFKRYTGQESHEERERIAANPPDILLTNFMMLELLMTRQDDLDRKVIGNCAGLRFLVLDELHTYRGRQGADVALLVRRVRERLAPDRLVCIGTSATMVSSGEGTAAQRKATVARVASTLFATRIDAGHVITETLRRRTNPGKTRAHVLPLLHDAVIRASRDGIPDDLSDADLVDHPLAIWVEVTLGIAHDEEQQWHRARPLTIREAADRLASDAGCDTEVAETALRNLLLQANRSEEERRPGPGASPRSFFAFKLHQFISGAGNAYATIEPPATRAITVDGQQFLPGGGNRRLYPVYFCRECGHEYHPVRLMGEPGRQAVMPRGIDDVTPASASRSGTDDADDAGQADTEGFITPVPHGDQGFAFRGEDDDYPDHWLEHDKHGTVRMLAKYREYRARKLTVSPDGRVGSGTEAWFLPGRFRICLRCKATHSGSVRDRNRLASLSGEGRSSATTVLVGSTLRWMHGAGSSIAEHTRKVLGFTDNRQDAALQAGHFNDFLFVSLLRAGFLRALRTAGPDGLRSAEIGLRVQHAIGFGDANDSQDVRREWLLEPTLVGASLQDASRTLRQVLAYRVWFDQRRGWRHTNPNLEQLSLLRVEYAGLEDLARDDAAFATADPILQATTPAHRREIYTVILDYLRKGMAVRSDVLEATELEQVRTRAFSNLRDPWGFADDERLSGSAFLMVATPGRRQSRFRDEELILSGGSRSALGRLLRGARDPRKPSLWPEPQAVRELKLGRFDEIIVALLDIAVRHGLVVSEASPVGDARAWRLQDSCVRFHPAEPLDADGAPPVTLMYFRDLYATLAGLLGTDDHPLFRFEAREHTAQVESERREIREKRFRFGDRERQELANDATLRDLGESSRFLPVLFCSPTMELGVDIAALNAVYLRNIPPTPANYAQRSGRAGRSGQAALALTYCAAQSPHDQYFFRDPKAMVHGQVRPPLLDLANRSLVESHLNAVWLAATGVALDPSIRNILDVGTPGQPVDQNIARPMSADQVRQEARERIIRVIALVRDELTPDAAPWFEDADTLADAIVSGASQLFDHAFDRWRGLLSAAEDQRRQAREVGDSYASPAAEKRMAGIRQRQAQDQIDLLTSDARSSTSDFYTYRYLATEGFLPGYNFPRLPLLAYIPNSAGNRRQTFLQRPRFLALAEFGPRSLVYHEGRAYRVVRAILSLGHAGQVTAETRLPTRAVKICTGCGAGHFADDSLCHACGLPLGDAQIINETYRIENVGTQVAERITANDEERRSQGFDLQTTFEWARRDGTVDVRRGVASDADGTVMGLSYSAGATITRLNKGLRRRASRTQFGFAIDPSSGFWMKTEDEDQPQTLTDPKVVHAQMIVPIVQDTKNALLVQPTAPGVWTQASLATLQHALLRGIEATFQLEEGEVHAEPVPTRDARSGFLLYEATEGGAGVLSRLVSMPDALQHVARAALQTMHFRTAEGEALPASSGDLHDLGAADCANACYRCLLSYFNQLDHELIDRHDHEALSVLLRLARGARTTGLDRSGASAGAGAGAEDPATSDDPVTRWWHTRTVARDLPPPDSRPLEIAGTTISLAWRAEYVVVVPAPTADVTQELGALGFLVIATTADESGWPDALDRLARAVGRTG